MHSDDTFVQSRKSDPLSRSSMARGCSRVDALVLILAFAISLAANSPLLWDYQYYLDDYLQFDKTIPQWIETRGVWRILGTLLPGWLASAGVYGLAAISL